MSAMYTPRMPQAAESPLPHGQLPHGHLPRSHLHDRLGRVLAHINAHLADDLSLPQLADVAHLSPFHFHRVYQAVFGETVAATTRRLRLQQAATWLATSTWPVAQVAQRCGFGSVEGFTRAFADAYGMPPAAFRTHGSHAAFKTSGSAKHVDAASHLALQVRIEPAAYQLWALEHRGPYLQIGEAFGRLFAQLAAAKAMPQQPSMVAVYLEDPTAVSPSALRSWAAVEAGAGTQLPSGLHAVQTHNGPCAVLRYQGPYSAMGAAYHWMFAHWLPQSGHLPGNAPMFERYLNSPINTAPNDLLTDIHLPLMPQDDCPP